jgi:hypothetical protein
VDYSVNIEAAGNTGKDRTEVVVLRRHTIVIVTDGEGGAGRGVTTAERCVSMMRDLALAARQPGPADVCAWLARVDDAILAEGMDYCMPRADDLCAVEVASNGVPTKTNPLGVKGAGEAGCVGALPAVMCAINDALAQVGAPYVEMPATPEKLWRAINRAAAA